MVSSSDIRIVRVVINTLSFFSILFLISPIKSSICPFTFLTSTVGSNSPVGLIICSLIVSLFCNKKGRGLIVPYILYAVFMGFILSGVCFTVDSPYVFGTALGFTSLIFLITCGIGALLGDKIKFVYLVLIYALFAIGFMCLFNFVLLPFLFMNSSVAINAFNAMLWGIEIIYFVVIIAYIAIDMNRLKAVANSNNGVITTNLALYCALNLFSDFIILFLRILYIVAMSSGKRKK